MKEDNLQTHQILRGQEGIAHHTKIREEENIKTKTQENQKSPEVLVEERRVAHAVMHHQQ